MAIAELLPSFDLLQLLFVGLAFFLGSLSMHLIAAKLVYSHPKFLNKVAVGVMSSAFVQMTQGKLLKKIVGGITEALGKIELPKIGDLMEQIPPELVDKLPSGIMEKVKGGEVGDIDSLISMIPGLSGGKGGGGLDEILGPLLALGKLTKGVSGVDSGSSGGYNPGG